MPFFTRDPNVLWVRTAVVLWAVLAVLVCGRAFRVGELQHSGVYPVFQKAGADWAAGRTVYPEVDSFYSFRYAPVYAAAFAALAQLPPVAGCFVWRALLVVGFLWPAVRWVNREVGPASRAELGAFLTLAVPLVAWDLVNGMTNALLAGLTLAAVTDLGRGRWWRASVWLALACLMKGYPVALVALLSLLYPRQLVPRFAVVLAAGLALPFLLQDPEYVARQYSGWLNTVAADDGRQEISLETSYRDVRLLFRVWGEPLSADAFRVLQLAGAVLAGWLCLARRWCGDVAAARFTALASGTLWMTALGPSTEGITYALVAPAMTWAVVTAVTRPTPGAVRVLVLAGYALTAAGFLGFLTPYGKAFASLGPQPAGALLFGAGLLVGEVRALRRATSPPQEPFA